MAIDAPHARTGGDAHNAKCAAHDVRGSRDRLLAPNQEPPLGTHLITPRRGYTHHGVYVGGRRVVQYGGLARGIRSGPVEEVFLAQFSRGRAVWIRLEHSACFDAEEVVRRARSRIGEDRYHLLTNNCEHFCEWCLRGEPRSYQVDALLSRSQGTLRMMSGLLSRLRTVLPRADRRGASRRCPI